MSRRKKALGYATLVFRNAPFWSELSIEKPSPYHWIITSSLKADFRIDYWPSTGRWNYRHEKFTGAPKALIIFIGEELT
tara:strand:+ start:745 stop:981 length:237 start_codon:yes stop_codon:yes gene_type:complete